VALVGSYLPFPLGIGPPIFIPLSTAVLRLSTGEASANVK